MGKIKLNLGSGPSGINGWLNYDSGVLPLLSKLPSLRHLICLVGFLPKSYHVSWPEIQLVDIRNKFPLEDYSVDYIYCSQVLEHFEKYEALRILMESKRVLRRGAMIRISVPDIEKMIEVYKKSKVNSPDTAAREINITWWGYEKDVPPANLFSKLSRIFIRDHQWQYDKNSMKQLLTEAGFGNIKFFPFKKGTLPDLNRIELEIHRPHSLYVEANA